MTTEEFFLVVIGALVGIGLLAVAGALIIRGRHTDEAATSEVDPTTEFKTMLARREGAIDAQVAELDSKLASLQELITSRETRLKTQVDDMGTQMKTITGLFTNDRTRGNWGEISMVRIFESGGLIEGLDYETQFSNDGRRPDAVVHIPGGCEVVIDSKFPQARYLEALEATDPKDRARLLNLQGKELETVGKDLVRRHYTDMASGSYVIMYLPSQAVYEAAIAAHPEVLERLIRVGVIVVGPNALFAVLMNIGSLMKEHRAIQQADEILAQAKDLQGRMTTFVGHLEKLGSALGRTVSAFNGAVGSWTSNVSPQLARIGELRGDTIDAQIIPIDEAVRELPETTHPFKAVNQ